MTRLSEQGRRLYASLRRSRMTAAKALATARRDADTVSKIYTPETIWARSPGNGQPFNDFGGPLRWIENPESCGLRFVGLAHDAAPANYAYSRSAVDHTGWFLDDEGFGETVAGVVYQLPARDGRPRYVVGYADPHNADRDGRGPAALRLTEVVEGEGRVESWGYDAALRDAAREADGYAERMAESERAYQREWRAGIAAKESAREMREAAAAWVQAVRATRAIFRNRHTLSAADRKLLFNAQKEQARDLCADLIQAREDFHNALEWRPGDAWREGYENA